MSYLPRSELIDRLDRLFDIRLIEPDGIHELDLAEIHDRLEAMQEAIVDLAAEREQLRWWDRLTADALSDREPTP